MAGPRKRLVMWPSGSIIWKLNTKKAGTGAAAERAAALCLQALAARCDRNLARSIHARLHSSEARHLDAVWRSELQVTYTQRAMLKFKEQRQSKSNGPVSLVG